MDEPIQATPSAEIPAIAQGQSEEQPAANPVAGSEPQTNTTEDHAAKLVPFPTDKLRELHQDRKELKALKAKLAEPTPPAAAPVAGEVDPAMQAMEMIADKVYSRLAPTLNRGETERVLTDIAAKPFAAELEREIVENFDLPELRGLPTNQRIAFAYNKALADNISNLSTKTTQAAEETGYNKAYEKIAEKEAGAIQAGGAAPNRGDSGEFTEDDLDSMSLGDYAKNREKIMKQLTGFTPRK